MELTLEQLPFDLLFSIALRLSLEDVVHLSRTCRQLSFLLEENTLCRRVVEGQSSYSSEAILARELKITYVQAVKRIYGRRRAFAQATPHSVRIIGYGSDFISREGVLCYLSEDNVHVVDIYGEAGVQTCICLLPILRRLAPSELYHHSKITLLHYSHHILVLHYELPDEDDSWLVAIDVSARDPDNNRLILEKRLQSSCKLFARNNKDYLYYGTHTGMGSHGHHEWIIYGISFKTKCHLPEIKLDEFVGSDIGSTVAFEIHNGYFYALSNQTSFDVEEVDWTSFYHCIRFPLDSPTRKKSQANCDIYRRQHTEGPINDSWTDLSLQIDEKTNELLIVEARREWKKSGSKQYRSYFRRRIPFWSSPSSAVEEDDMSGIISTGSSSSSAPPLLPANDIFVGVLTSDNNPHWAPPQPRHECNTHPEYGYPDDRENAPSFMLARTKLRAYNLSSSAFIDLVEDASCCPHSSPLSGPCLRLRVGSRLPAPHGSLDDTYSDALILALDDLGDTPLANNTDPTYEPPPEAGTRYRYNPIRMWPPSPTRTVAQGPSCHCTDRLHQVLNPPLVQDGGRIALGREIRGFVDERSLVYMIQPVHGYDKDIRPAHGPIIVVSFDTTPVWPNEREDTRTSNEGKGKQWKWWRRRQSCTGQSCLC